MGFGAFCVIVAVVAVVAGISVLGRRHGREAIVARLREPAGPVLVVDLGRGLAPFLTALEQTGADDDLVLACWIRDTHRHVSECAKCAKEEGEEEVEASNGKENRKDGGREKKRAGALAHGRQGNIVLDFQKGKAVTQNLPMTCWWWYGLLAQLGHMKQSVLLPIMQHHQRRLAQSQFQ